MRILSFIFLRKYCLSYVFNSRIKNHTTHVKYRGRIIEGLLNPEDFTCIKHCWFSVLLNISNQKMLACKEKDEITCRLSFFAKNYFSLLFSCTSRALSPSLHSKCWRSSFTFLSTIDSVHREAVHTMTLWAPPFSH